ncbi:peptidase B [Candidatus Photodesmus blepharus]|uniref:Peptidase B n=1 Tax=Candidatus Photodesmus blepharonis TaxID=1179155 RepID=A0A084CPE1_9GAMM|nr:aminopeptidase PepB [Candidatus Photodesmus blepharus]KEY91670.1 peptidase B [Candidatus Photodesmus blepharus]
MLTTMPVHITCRPAKPQWGKNAFLSFSESSATIHLNKHHNYSVIQLAARKLCNLGILSVSLRGEGWDLENIWIFHQSYYSPQNRNLLKWNLFSEVEKKELESRIKVTNWTRDITNKSAEEVTPYRLATMVVEFIKSVAPEGMVTAKMVKDKNLLIENWQGIYAVGRGSKQISVMLQLDYNPTFDVNAPVFSCLVGKGITFDSGGYSLKSSALMSSMKADMGGSGIIAGALALAIMRGLKKRVKLILCCAENMISGKAIKLGDIISYKNGKTVEIMDTDAEGRLVLADGLLYASEQNPEMIIDCATLTGSAKSALGNDYHALLSFDEEFSDRALTIAQEEKEGLWRLPLADFHRGMLVSNFADLSNINGDNFFQDASVAAAFLSYFVDNYKKKWLHFDCSGAYRKVASDILAAGATGMGVRTIAQIITNG